MIEKFYLYFIIGGHVLGTVVTFVWGYSRLHNRVETIEKSEDKEENRFKVLEHDSSRQQEINIKLSEQFHWIQEKMKDMENLIIQSLSKK